MELKITIPETLNEIKLSQWQKWAAIPENSPNDYKDAYALMHFLGINTIEQKRLRSIDRSNLLNSIYDVLASKPEFKQRFYHNGIEYGIVPNFDDMSYGEMLDIESIKDYKKELHKLMSIIYRPVTKDYKNRLYDIQEYSGISDDLHDMPLGIALGAMVFFYTIGKDCLSYIQSYLKNQPPITPTNKLLKNGVDMHSYINSAKAILQESMLLLNSISANVYFGLPTSPTRAKQTTYTEKV